MSLNRTLANLINTDGDVKAANLDLAASITVVEALDSLPTSNLTAGDQAYVKGTSRFYVSNGAGWYNAALVNATPSLSIDPSGAITLATDGSTTTITLTATDSDYPDAALTYTVESDGNFGGLATVSQDSSVFTITPLSEDSATTASAVLTFKASDGVSFGSGDRTLTLNFKVENSNYTTLLLKADSDGTDNQVDASTNAHTVSEYGNVTSTAFTPHHPGGYSAYLDGTGDYISTTHDTTLKVASEDFTFECWWYPLVSQTSAQIAGDFVVTSYPSNCSGWDIILSGGNLFLRWGAPSYQDFSTGTAPNYNSWNHLVLTRNSSTIAMFLNGNRIGSDTSSINFIASTSANFYVGWAGSQSGTTINPIEGYIRDARLVKGTTVYDPDSTTLTVPTEPLTAITNTELLTCHLPYIADGSTNNHSITVAGNTKTERFGPYDYIGYTKTDYGGSVHFDGTGDYIQTPNGTYMNYGSDDFTFEAWIYPTASNGDRHIASDYSSSGNMTTGSFHTLIDDGILRTYARVGGVNIIGGLDGTTTIQLNVWHHVALVRNGNVFTLYLNGESEASTTQSGAMNVSTQPFTIGRAGNYAGALFQGYISNARLVKGTAVYTSAFTPPTEPLTAITNTELLTCTNKNDIWDIGQGTRLLKSGSVTASNTQRKFISSSAMYFDGNDALQITPGYDDPLYNFGTHDWTVEGWFYFQNLSGARNLLSMLRAGATATIPHFYTSGSTVKYYVSGADKIVTSSVLTLNTWHHIAWVRNGNEHKIYVDGTASGTTWTQAQTYTQGRPTLADYYISLNTLSGQNNLFTGYMQDIRFTKGLARYTANFTPTTTEFSG